MTYNSVVAPEPGVYIISGGKFEVGNKAELRGEGVSFYFADDAATIAFKDKAVIELSAPTEGLMAGILFYENPDAQSERVFEFTSDSARTLLGTIYLPRGIFKVGKGGEVAEASAYTIIVANRIELDGGNLVVNADDSSSEVPVPSGLGPDSLQVTLTQ